MPANTGNGAGLRRSGAVVMAAVAVALTGWAVIRLLGVELAVDKGGSSDTVDAADAAVAAVVAGLAARGVVALLAWRGALRWWPFVGSTALAVSMLGPSYQADGGSAMALTCLHLLVGAVLIAGFASLRSRRREAAESSARAGVS